MILIRQYKASDLNILEEFMNNLQDYTVKVDQLKRNKRAENYGEYFAQETIKEVEENNGIIYIAEYGEKAVGFIAGILHDQTKENKLSVTDLRKEGRITELYVEESKRGQGVGKMLMEKLENYFKEKECGVVRVEVFEPNKLAYEFYKKVGYKDRVIDMMKEL